jgi:D-methionine transport system ATP-binding protein
MIQLQSIDKTYTSKKTSFHALSNINLSIHDGEILGIVGYSGAGKSTLLRIINGLILPDHGQVIVDSVDTNQLSLGDMRRMRQSMGMIFQHFNLIFSMTVKSNIMLALSIANYPKDLREKRIFELLDLVGLTGKENRYPVELSGGERQRLGIARALSNHPKYLLCDEATSALDQKTAQDIIKLLKQIQEKTKITIIFISHQIEIVKDLCTRVVVMDQGNIIEDQNVKALFTHPISSITKSLIRSLVYEPKDISKEIYELIYDHKNSDSMTLSDMIKIYQVDVNIMFAKTLELKDEVIGYLYLQIEGKNKEQALAFLRDAHVEVNRYV